MYISNYFKKNLSLILSLLKWDLSYLTSLLKLCDRTISYHICILAKIKLRELINPITATVPYGVTFGYH